MRAIFSGIANVGFTRLPDSSGFLGWSPDGFLVPRKSGQNFGPMATKVVLSGINLRRTLGG